MKENINKFLFLLLKYASNNTLKNIFNFLYQNTLIPIKNTDFSYDLFLMLIKNPEDKKVKQLETFLTAIDEVISNSNFLPIDKKNINNIELIIELSLKHKKVLHWSNKEVFYYDLNDILNHKLDMKICKIKKTNSKIYINNNEVKNIRRITTKSGIRRFSTVYESLALAIDCHVKYCPWCNPDEKIKPSPRPRRNDECSDISEFIVYYGGYNAKDLNDSIIHIKGSNIQETRTLRGEKLKQIINNIAANNVKNNDTIFKENYTDTLKKVKKRYGIK